MKLLRRHKKPKKTGHDDWMLQKDCKYCKNGMVTVIALNGHGKFVPFIKSICEECNGTGKENSLRIPPA